MIFEPTAIANPLTIPESLERFLAPELNIYYQTRLLDDLIQATQITETFSEAVNSLKASVPSQEEVFANIEALKSELDYLVQESINKFTAVNLKYSQVVKAIHKIQGKISLWTQDYLNLTEGWQQFEEYDSADPDYDPHLAKSFLKSVANKYVVEATEESLGCPDLKKFLKGLRDLKSEIQKLVASNTPIFDQVQEADEILTLLEDSTKAAKFIQEAIEGADDIDVYNYDEIDSSLKHKSKSLQKGAQEFEDFHDNYLEPLLGAWEELTEALHEYEDHHEELEEEIDHIENKLAKELDILRNRIQAHETHGGESNKKALTSGASSSLAPSQKTLLYKLNLIILRDQINILDKTDNIPQLSKKLIPQVGKVNEAFNDYLISAECEETNILNRSLIDLIRFVNQEKKLLEAQEQKLLKIAQPFVATVGQLSPTKNYAFAHIKTPQGPKIFGIEKTLSQNKVDTPLVSLIQALSSQQQISTGCYHGLLHLPFISPNIPTPFELGLVNIRGLGAKLATYSIFQKALAQNSSHPTQQATSAIQWLTHIPNSNLKVFLPSVPYKKTEVLTLFDDSAEELYMLLTMSLVSFFTNKTNRRSFNLPGGSPIVCLIVSKEGEVLSWAVNASAEDPTRHAETDALRLYFDQHPEQPYLPEGVRIFTSLKSCAMCAGGISSCLHPDKITSNSAKIIFGQNDPCQSNTALTALSQQIEHVSKIDTFILINKTYDILKKSQANSDTTTNAADSLMQDEQKKHLQEIYKNFCTKLQTASPQLKMQIENFLEAHHFCFQNEGLMFKSSIAASSHFKS